MARKLPNLLQADEPEKLLRATTRERDRLALFLMYLMGLRVSEVCKLEVPHLDFRKAMLAVRSGKGDKDRFIPIPTFLVGPLRGFVGKRRAGYVFESPRGGRLTERAYQKLIKRLAVAAGLPDALAPRRATPHKFRHAFASEFLDRTENIIALRDALGHASVATTQVYTHVNPERLRALMER